MGQAPQMDVASTFTEAPAVPRLLQSVVTSTAQHFLLIRGFQSCMWQSQTALQRRTPVCKWSLGSPILGLLATWLWCTSWLVVPALPVGSSRQGAPWIAVPLPECLQVTGALEEASLEKLDLGHFLRQVEFGWRRPTLCLNFDN